MIRTMHVIVMLLSATLLFAADARFDDPKQQARYDALINELRCLVCQNQTIADSNADLALDLKLVWLTLVAIVNRPAALAGVAAMLERLDADPQLRRVALRREPLVPAPLP